MPRRKVWRFDLGDGAYYENAMSFFEDDVPPLARKLYIPEGVNVDAITDRLLGRSAEMLRWSSAIMQYVADVTGESFDFEATPGGARIVVAPGRGPCAFLRRLRWGRLFD